ncbi:MAG TPA: hypothetical protein VII33_20745, partial [Nakamurella sp.]
PAPQARSTRAFPEEPNTPTGARSLMSHRDGLRPGHFPISLTTPRRTVADVFDKGRPEEAEETSPQTGG